MALRIDKPWRELTDRTVAALPGQLGVFQIADGDDTVIFIGMAGGRSLFGLRSLLGEELARRPAGAQFRYEVNQQYWSRYRELLMLHIADHGEPPMGNIDSLPAGLGRLSPAGRGER